MKAENKNSVVAKTTTSRKEYKIATNSKMKDRYYDECWSYHDFRSDKKKILMYQVRMLPPVRAI